MQLVDRFVSLRAGYGRDVCDAALLDRYIRPVLDQGRRVRRGHKLRAMIGHNHPSFWRPVIVLAGFGVWWLHQRL